ncbi:E3 ubiquitin-protein ligase RING1-like [Panicum virgatum]|uniref:E3 ubiquitin-protein ligase RING1-like n=1 Tax=Panicum virgatum TaxID=38727 RepID=UPI0019D639A1|nr:E3 ubiquitin-protein ligase RING1-like [Panicum virgatum]
MPPPPEQEEQKPLPRPKPKLPKPKTGPEPRPKPPGPLPLPQRDATPSGGLLFPPDPFACVNNCSGSCAFYRLCPPPASHAATVHLRSGRLPTPLIALSASLLAVSAVLLLALLVHRLVRRRRRRRRAREAALAQGDEEGGQVLAGAVAGDGEEEEEAADGDGVHHVWYIRTKGLDERAIAAIAAVVYDAKKRGGAGAVHGGSCAVCLAEFRDGETLRLLPRCGHAFHRGCIDTWLRAHVNCPLCRAPVQVASAAAAAPGAATATPGGEPDPDPGAAGVPRRAEDAERGGVPDRAVRRAASMVALPRRAWPDVSFRAPASSSGREEDLTGLGKIMRLLKLADSLEMAGVGAGRSASFGAGSCQRLPTRSGPSAAGVSSGEMPQ